MSFANVFCNDKFFTNIRECENRKGVHLLSNGGYQDSTHVGDLKNFGPVWYNPESLADILSLSVGTKQCLVTMDLSAENALIVHKKDSSTMKFKNYKYGLYYYDATKSSSKSKQSVTSYSFYLLYGQTTPTSPIASMCNLQHRVCPIPATHRYLLKALFGPVYLS